MTTGMALDYITEYLDMKDPKKQENNSKKSRIRIANQADFDKF